MNKVNPKEAPPGYRAVRAAHDCEGCARKYLDEVCVAAYCTPLQRKDGCNTILKRLPRKPKVTRKAMMEKLAEDVVNSCVRDRASIRAFIRNWRAGK